MLTRVPRAWNVGTLSSAESEPLGPLHEGESG